MITNENILVAIRAFSNHQKKKKKNYENIYTNEIISKAATIEFLSKVPNRKKISNAYFNLC